jgi:bacterioferritin
VASEKLREMLNGAIAREIAVSVQYMWQHVTVKGMYAEAVGPVFRRIALVEMLHAEMIAERLDYLGGVPTTSPTKIEVNGGDPVKMLRNDIRAEEEAIAMYKEIIKLAAEEGDITTRKLFEDILREEEDHHNTFTNMLEK